jgi:RsiW-degrading membrane proteinase PrsW (M82 family)
MLLLTAAAALVPSLLLLWYFHSRDRNPEPRRVLWATFGLGVLAVVPVLLVALPVVFLVERVTSPVLSGLLCAFGAAALPEELCKLLVLLLYCRRHREFDEPIDGVVYGVAASLGFATLENVLYVLDGGLPVALMRACTAVPGHAFTGAIMGYYVGLTLAAPARRGAQLTAAFLVPVLLHGLYDWPLLTVEAMGIEGRELSSQEALIVLACIAGTLVVLVLELLLALRGAHRLRALQAAAPPPATSAPLATTVPPPPPCAPGEPHRAAGWLLVGSGGCLTALGTLLAFLVVVGVAARGLVPTRDLILVTCLLGGLPVALGLILIVGGWYAFGRRGS